MKTTAGEKNRLLVGAMLVLEFCCCQAMATKDRHYLQSVSKVTSKWIHSATVFHCKSIIKETAKTIARVTSPETLRQKPLPCLAGTPS